MHPFFIFIIVGTALRFSSVCGINTEHRAAYDRVVECLSKGMHIHRPEQVAKLPFETVICDIFKVWLASIAAVHGFRHAIHSAKVTCARPAQGMSAFESNLTLVFSLFFILCLFIF